jgi:acyl-CoA reductase-like NAD-dependent aldehyde dehydrogenase
MSGIGGLSFGMVTHPSVSTSQSDLKNSKAASSSAVDEFLAYMKKSLAERMADAWLAAHGLDREKLKAMKPDERDAVLKQMAEELKQQLKQAAVDAKTGAKSGAKTGAKTEAA